MTWLIVVGVVVAVAIAVHFYEEQKSRAKLKARKARLPSAAHLSFTQRVSEKWDLDLEAMVAVVTRSDDRSATTTWHFRLVKQPSGDLALEPSATFQSPLPAGLNELLDAQRTAP